MKNIHPEYRPVVFRDRGAGVAFLTRSTAVTSQTIEWEDGRAYPVVDVDVSSASHPFYTGKNRALDSTGAVEKFNRRYNRPRS
ncbi:type B 50S ribosomal protein L31 [Actinomadura rubrisoli]|uniref:Large ribosomal subunit protein bL31B n=1 Tax=Actinomadura rubrisoli TaxID=2530368 RepID=A0A4R5C276_9ACTN|nr:type B 50S ribosomal protein L31 [Actinomadura rubrisoli]TDD93718.1 type B 50S ribosomal protein L31 [Actinomadura rubrisoli]